MTKEIDEEPKFHEEDYAEIGLSEANLQPGLTDLTQAEPEELLIDVTSSAIDELWTEISKGAVNATAKQKQFTLKQWEDEECHDLMIFL